MSAFVRFLHPTPIARRAYSSFFSSKPGGGGRYFNSAKPPKAVIPGSATKNNVAKAVDSSKDSKVDGVQTTAGGGSGNVTNGGNGPSQTVNPSVDQTAQPLKQSSSSSSSSSSNAASGTSSGSSDANAASAGSPGERHTHSQRQHPVVNAKDFKLHQFFSLHRPLLLLPTPSSILTSAPANLDLSDLNATADVNSAHSSLLDEFPEASMDADAAAARQLTRAFTINHAGATVAWEDTLRRLGLDVDQDAERVNMQRQWSREWQEIMMDSTKRKRRKKMKKHKSVIAIKLFIPCSSYFASRMQAEKATEGTVSFSRYLNPVTYPVLR